MRYLARKSAEWGIPISVNISSRTFTQGDVVEFIKSAMEEYKDSKLTVEITERVAAQNLNLFIKNVQELKEINKNIKVAVDDFGTGYSALSYLKDLPVDLIKIDMSFVHNIDIDEKNEKFLKSVITMIKLLGYKTLAEGVENSAQLDILKHMDCDYAQGFYLCKPLPEEDIRVLLGLK